MLQENFSSVTGMTPSYIMVVPENIEWTNTPLSMPIGYRQAMIEGNPRFAALFTFRAKIPANWIAMPHMHSEDEHITVVEGTCYLGIGEKYDEDAAAKLPIGSFTLVKAGTAHYFFTRQSCIIQVHGMGPQKIFYINPADDPRNKK